MCRDARIHVFLFASATQSIQLTNCKCLQVYKSLLFYSILFYSILFSLPLSKFVFLWSTGRVVRMVKTWIWNLQASTKNSTSNGMHWRKFFCFPSSHNQLSCVWQGCFMCWVSWVVLVASICFSHLLATKFILVKGRKVFWKTALIRIAERQLYPCLPTNSLKSFEIVLNSHKKGSNSAGLQSGSLAAGWETLLV